MKNEQLVQQAISALSLITSAENWNKAVNDEIVDSLRRFLMSNQPDINVKGKFDLYDYVVAEKLDAKYRPHLTGVFHQNGFRIATNTNILVALAEQSYNPDFEDKILDKEMNEIKGRSFPNWKGVVPDKESMNKTWKIDRKQVVDAVKVSKQRKKEDKNAVTFVHIDNVVLNPELLLKLVDFALIIGVDELQMNTESRYSAVGVYAENGSVGILMPCVLHYDVEKLGNGYIELI